MKYYYLLVITEANWTGLIGPFSDPISRNIDACGCGEDSRWGLRWGLMYLIDIDENGVPETYEVSRDCLHQIAFEGEPE